MHNDLIIAIVCMIMALIAYSIGVWSEHIAGYLKMKHVMFFWIGFCFDSFGTMEMTRIGKTMGKSDLYSVHGYLGMVAILFMLLHAAVATYVILKKQSSLRIQYHKFSTIVWSFWVVVFLLGMLIGMS